MPTLSRDGWELESAEDRHARDPGQFEIPGREERTDLRPGARVVLLFRFRQPGDGDESTSCEKMVVCIDGIAGAMYEGVLESQPVTSRALQSGERVKFGPEHVATIMIPGTDPRHPQFAIAARVRAKRIRQIVVLGALLPALVILKLGHGLPGLGNAPQGILYLGALGVVALAIVYSLWNWRCPQCGGSLGRGLSPTHCPKCGVSFLH
jgi:hypothetical protein